MKRLIIPLLALSVMVFSGHAAWSAVQAKKESRFSIYSHGLRIGEARSTCSQDNNDAGTVRFSNSTRINARFIVRSYALDSREQALVGKSGTISYSRASKENGKLTEVSGQLENERFLLDISEDGIRRTMAIPRKSYDYTTMECPETTLRHVGDRQSMRLLDLENLEVVTRHYSWVRNEEVRIDGKSYSCRVIDFEDKNKKCRRWIRPDDIGVIIARQDGSGKAGTYSVRMVEYR